MSNEIDFGGGGGDEATEYFCPICAGDVREVQQQDPAYQCGKCGRAWSRQIIEIQGVHGS